MDIVSNLIDAAEESIIDIDDFLKAVFVISEVQKNNEIKHEEKSVIDNFIKQLQDLINSIGR